MKFMGFTKSMVSSGVIHVCFGRKVVAIFSGIGFLANRGGVMWAFHVFRVCLGEKYSLLTKIVSAVFHMLFIFYCS